MAAYIIIDQAISALAGARQQGAPQQAMAELESGLADAARLIETDAPAAQNIAVVVYYKARGLASGWEAIAWEVRAYPLCQQPGGALCLLAVTRNGQVVGIHGSEPRQLWLTRESRPVEQVDGREVEQATWEYLATASWTGQDGWRVLASYEYDGDYNWVG